MRYVHLRLALVVATLALVPAGVMAQDSDQSSTDPEDSRRVDFSASAGGMLPSSWSGLVVIGSISSASGALEQVLARDLKVEPNTQFTTAVTYWRGRYGFRTQGGFSRSSLRIGSTPVGDSSLTPPNGSTVGVDTYFYDVRGAIGFLNYNANRWVWPYGFFGLGGITYKLSQPITPPLTFIGTAPIQSDGNGNTVVVAQDGRQFVLAVNELSNETVFAFNFGIGTEFRIPTGGAGVGLRIELADQVSQSPLHVDVQQIAGPGHFAPTNTGFPVVHQLSATAGVVVRIGR